MDDKLDELINVDGELDDDEPTITAVLRADPSVFPAVVAQLDDGLSVEERDRRRASEHDRLEAELSAKRRLFLKMTPAQRYAHLEANQAAMTEREREAFAKMKKPDEEKP